MVLAEEDLLTASTVVTISVLITADDVAMLLSISRKSTKILSRLKNSANALSLHSSVAYRLQIYSKKMCVNLLNELHNE